jgi:hypothetical protein
MPDLFEFDLKAVEHDREGYYFPRWDRATPITITATTKQDAINKAAAMLGPCPRGRGWYWGFRVGAIRSAVTA